MGFSLDFLGVLFGSQVERQNQSFVCGWFKLYLQVIVVIYRYGENPLYTPSRIFFGDRSFFILHHL